MRMIENHKRPQCRQAGHHEKTGALYGHGLICYGHFLLEFFINLLHVLTPGTKDVLVQYSSTLGSQDGELDLQYNGRRKYPVSAAVKNNECLREIWPGIALRYVTTIVEASGPPIYEFTRICQMSDEMVRERMLAVDRLRNDIWKEDIPMESPPVVYMQREPSVSCHDKQVENEPEITGLLGRLFGGNFTVLNPGQLTLKQQIKSMKNVRVIIGQEGSVNLGAVTFALPNAIVLTDATAHRNRSLCTTTAIFNARGVKHLSVPATNTAIRKYSQHMRWDTSKLEKIIRGNASLARYLDG